MSVESRLIPLLHKSDSVASPFSCLPRCMCGWTGERVHGLDCKKFVAKAMAQYGRHVVEQFRLADPAVWAEVDAYKAAREKEGR